MFFVKIKVSKAWLVLSNKMARCYLLVNVQEIRIQPCFWVKQGDYFFSLFLGHTVRWKNLKNCKCHWWSAYCAYFFPADDNLFQEHVPSQSRKYLLTYVNWGWISRHFQGILILLVFVETLLQLQDRLAQIHHQYVVQTLVTIVSSLFLIGHGKYINPTPSKKIAISP